MKIIVQKYGGTSVGSIEKIKQIATNIKKLKNFKLLLLYQQWQVKLIG